VVVPTFKERGNVAELVRRLDAALTGIAWEAIFVDDNSPDGTAAAVKEIAAGDIRVRCLRRVGRRGLAGACIEGILSSAAPYVAVIDADLQHDEKVLPAMLSKLRGDADLLCGRCLLCRRSDLSLYGLRRSDDRIGSGMRHHRQGKHEEGDGQEATHPAHRTSRGGDRHPRRGQRAAQSRTARSAGNSTTSRIDSLPVRSITKRSIPKPRPPVGGIPYERAST